MLNLAPTFEAEYRDEFRDDLERVGTHDCRFTRAYLAGYFTAKLEDRAPFAHTVPDGWIPTLRTLAAAAGARLTTGRSKRNHFAVHFTRIRIRFP